MLSAINVVAVGATTGVLKLESAPEVVPALLVPITLK